MNDQHETPQVATAEPTDLQILNGGIEIEVIKIDGGSEKVKVRQLPIRLIDQWGNGQGDEAFLVELLCDKIDRSTDFNLRNARSTELRILQLLAGAPFEQIGPINERLAKVRAEIEALEKKPRWSDELTEDSIVLIRELGDRLNKKKFGRWAIRTSEAVKAVTKEATPPAEAASPNVSS